MFSKFPIIDKQWRRLHRRRPWLETRLEIAGRAVDLYTIHASPWLGVFGRHSEDYPFITKLMVDAAAARRAVVAGDFNTTERSPVWGAFARLGMRDAFRETSSERGDSFPTFRRYRGLPIPPMFRVDAVWRSLGFITLSARLHGDWGSDHLALSVALGFVD